MDLSDVKIDTDELTTWEKQQYDMRVKRMHPEILTLFETMREKNLTMEHVALIVTGLMVKNTIIMSRG
jgi:hypothetical protein